ncbi:MAG: hypothetical protein ACOC8F_01360, partial [Planctomycetota bacterium]
MSDAAEILTLSERELFQRLGWFTRIRWVMGGIGLLILLLAGPAMGGGFAQRDPMPAGPTRIDTALYGHGVRQPVAPFATPARRGAAMPPRIGQNTQGGQYADGMNLYQYVGSNPTGFVDPSGLFRKYICCNQNLINTIKQDEARALQQIQALQAQLNAAIAADQGQYPAFTGSALRKSVSYLNTAAGVIRNKDVKCEPAGASRQCKAGAIAWQKWIFAQTVHLCPTYFGGRYGPIFRASTLVHEGTHFAGTLDVRYFTHHREWPHRVGLTGWHDIASTYDTQTDRFHAARSFSKRRIT